MIVSVTVHEDGAVTVTSDTDGETDDEQPFRSLQYDELYARTTQAAYETWLMVQGDDNE